MHALKAVPKAEGGRGKKGGGLAAYAGFIGKSKQYVGDLRMGAEVAVTCKLELTSLIDKTKHLSEIHSAPDHRPADQRDTLIPRMLCHGWAGRGERVPGKGWIPPKSIQAI